MMYRYYGMVRLEERGRRLACDWDVRAACPGALETAGRYLRRAGRPVILRFYFGGWQEEYFDNPEIACQRMATSSVYAQAEPLLRPSVLRRPISEARDARRPYGKLLRTLEAADGRLTPELQQTLEARGLFRRLVLLEEQAIKGPLIMRHIGEHSGLARFYGPKWRQEALGQPFEQVPFAIEHQYSLFDVYRRTLERREARFDHVRFPVAAGSEELRWISCERLLAPYSLADGRRRGSVER